jgi:C-3',4' desaturase CrtD
VAAKSKHVAIIGAGVGGLTTAALLLRAGCQVTVLEAQTYPGGSAGTFYHQGYRFDAGATLAGGFAPGGPHARLGELLGLEWPVRLADPAWVTYLPGLRVTQWHDRARWHDEVARAFPGTQRFWRQQEHLAELSWQIAARPFPWPPASARDLYTLARKLNPALLLAAPYAVLPIASLLPRGAPGQLRSFLDANLLISAQATSSDTNALYASTALDVPRRGMNHVRGGMGALCETLAGWIRAHGGKIHYRQEVCTLTQRAHGEIVLGTRKGMQLRCDAVVANLLPSALDKLLDPNSQTKTPPASDTKGGWGAFVLYLGIEEQVAQGLPSEHLQVVVDPRHPLGEGNSVFISLNDPQDLSRAPAGMRAATLSTHTAAAPWWRLLQDDPNAYAERKAEYTRKTLAAAEIAIPGLGAAVRLCLPGTPVTYHTYTRRPLGLVGGLPQRSLLAVRGPHTRTDNVFLVGDSIFPGQSTAGVTLGAFRSAAAVLEALKIRHS